MNFTAKNRVRLIILILFFGLVVQGSFAMFRRRNSRRGIPTKEGIYCPRCDKVFASEADLGPRQYRNRSNDANSCNWRRGRGMGGRGRGIPTKEGIYCPRCDKVFASEADLEPRQYRNRENANFPCNWGRGRGMGGRGRGRGRNF